MSSKRKFLLLGCGLCFAPTRLTVSLYKMFSILNEIGNSSHFRTTGVVVASIGFAAMIYILVAITGYLSFGNAVAGNIVGMCMCDPSV